MPLDDERWMQEALGEARRAQAVGEVPVGAVIVHPSADGGRIVGRGGNRNITQNDPTAHAEIVALREAARELRNYRLNECEIYVTIEPCAMCAGAIVQARLARLIYGASDPKAGAVGSALQVLHHPAMNHRVEVISGVLAGVSQALLQDFFRARRES